MNILRLIQQSSIFVRDIVSARICDLAVDYRYLAVRTVIEPHIERQRYLVERSYVDAASTCADLVLNAGSYPVYGNTATKYYPLGDVLFPDRRARDRTKGAEHSRRNRTLLY